MWLTYDVRNLAPSVVEEIRVNGGLVPIALSRESTKSNSPIMPAQNQGGTSSPSAPLWFCEVGSLLRIGDKNTISIRVRRWPVPPNTGAWLYAPPAREQILFLISTRLDPHTQSLARHYAVEVEKRFPIHALIREASPSSPAALRTYIRKVWHEEAIGGVVLIGDHALPTVPSPVEPKAWPRYCEALRKEGELPVKANPFHEEMDVWTAWIRTIPDKTNSVESVLRKALAYFQGKLCFPNTGIIAPDPDGNPFAVPHCGLALYDLIWGQADLMYFNAHGGTSFHGQGPHNSVTPNESAEAYPGPLMLKLYGCSAGNIARPHLTPAEGFLVGRPVTQVVITHTTPQGGAFKNVAWRTYNDLLRVCPHAGIMYQYFYDMRLKNPYSLIMLGNPFVRVGSAAPAQSGSIEGTVKGCGADHDSALYVTAQHNGKCYGRVRVSQDRRFRLRCLPPGEYDLELYINALEKMERRVEVRGNQTVEVDWEIKGLKSVSGTVVLGNSTPAPDAWVELAGSPRKQEFSGNDLFGVPVGDQGQFSFFVLRINSLYVRGCLGKRTRTKAIHIEVPQAGLREVVVRIAKVEREQPVEENEDDADGADE